MTYLLQRNVRDRMAREMFPMFPKNEFFGLS